MSKRYIVHSNTCYFSTNNSPYILYIEDNKVYAIDKDISNARDITRFTSVRKAKLFIAEDLWKEFITIKEVKEYAFKCELDKTLGN